jgi:hypothetical protein
MRRPGRLIFLLALSPRTPRRRLEDALKTLASRKISCAQGPCQLQCRFQLLITYVAVIWVSIAYLYSLRVLNCMGHFCEHRPRTRLCDFDFDCCGIAMHISVTDLICCCDLGFNCVHSVRNAECFPFMKFLCSTVLCLVGFRCCCWLCFGSTLWSSVNRVTRMIFQFLCCMGC